MHSRPGALDFATYWLRALDWGYATTDSTIVRNLYLRSCAPCKNFVHNFDFTARRHRHFEGGRIRLTQAVVIGANLANPQPVDITFDVAPLKIMDSQGRVLRRSAGEHLTFRIWVGWTGSRWRVAREAQVVHP